jgi:ribokinase
MRVPGVAVVGSINADLTAYASPLPRPGQTVLGGRFSMVLGGKGANQAVAAARSGVRVHLVGAVGDDVFGRMALADLAAAGVETSAVAVLEAPTGIAHIRVDIATGQNDIVIVPQANLALTPERAEARLRALANQVSVVLVQLEIPLETVVRVAEVCVELGLTLVLDPAPARQLPVELWPLVAVVTPNETEAELVTGLPVEDAPGAAAAARWLVDRGAGTAVVTLGASGAVTVRDGVTTRVAPFVVKAVDTTAAGDAFNGVLGASLALGISWKDALRRALAAGALAATVPGASPSLPTSRQVDDFLAHRAG